MLRSCHLTSRLVRQVNPTPDAGQSNIFSRTASYAARIFGEHIPEEEEVRQREEARKREQADGILASAIHAQALGLVSETSSSVTQENGSIHSCNTKVRISDPIHRMCSVLMKVSFSDLKSHRLLGYTTNLHWDRMLEELRHYDSGMRNKSSGLFSLSTVGCALVGGAQLLNLNKAKLPNLMQIVGESCKAGKGALDVGMLETSRTKYSTLKELYSGAINQGNKTCESLQANIDLATQTIQTIEERRTQECSSILSGKG